MVIRTVRYPYWEVPPGGQPLSAQSTLLSTKCPYVVRFFAATQYQQQYVYLLGAWRELGTRQANKPGARLSPCPSPSASQPVRPPAPSTSNHATKPIMETSRKKCKSQEGFKEETKRQFGSGTERTLGQPCRGAPSKWVLNPEGEREGRRGGRSRMHDTLDEKRAEEVLGLRYLFPLPSTI